MIYFGFCVLVFYIRVIKIKCVNKKAEIILYVSLSYLQLFVLLKVL